MFCAAVQHRVQQTCVDEEEEVGVEAGHNLSTEEEEEEEEEEGERSRGRDGERERKEKRHHDYKVQRLVQLYTLQGSL